MRDRKGCVLQITHHLTQYAWAYFEIENVFLYVETGVDRAISPQG